MGAEDGKQFLIEIRRENDHSTEYLEITRRPILGETGLGAGTTVVCRFPL